MSVLRHCAFSSYALHCVFPASLLAVSKISDIIPRLIFTQKPAYHRLDDLIGKNNKTGLYFMASPLEKIKKKIHHSSEQYAHEVRDTLSQLPHISAKFEYLTANRQFIVDQKKLEFMSLLEKVQSSKPKIILEIGGRRGGSALMFSLAAGGASKLVSMDIKTSDRKVKNLKILCGDHDVDFWEADSHAEETIQRLSDHLNGEKIDFMFIDGDHSYEGAKQDFIRFAPFMSEGGLIGLHDIQLDFTTRYKVNTNCWTGGVPEFWKEIVSVGFDIEELISDPYQDGYGIGTVRWSTLSSAKKLEQLTAITPEK